MFRNNVFPLLGQDGRLTLVLQADAVVRQYGADGSLEWSVPLSEPEVEAARERFYREWREAADQLTVIVPWTVRAGRVFEDEIWLLLAPGDGHASLMLVLDRSTGQVLRRLELRLPSPAGPFAVDRDRNALYFTLPDEAALLRTSLP